ncbi:MAG TPA: hypothetical protein PKG90_10095 [Chitinophagaceae bacterium]|nr:hypothetical protein [Chitinophagaceae bacterium]HNU14471.1 hypothetical protein [Chitinophagaceae bacterium]
MESNFNNRDFERFLKQNADQYRMFPSENVWKGIHSTLHTRRRWYGIGLALLLLTTGAVTWVMLTSSPSSKENELAANKQVIVPVKKIQKEQQPIVITPLKKKDIDEEILIASPGNHQKNLFLATPIVEDQDNKLTELQKTNAVIPISNSPGSLPATIASVPSPVSKVNTSGNNRAAVKAETPKHNVAVNIVPAIINEEKIDQPSLVPAENNKTDEVSTAAQKDIYPLSIESVINSYKSSRKSKRLSWQVYFTPTISYRELKENKQFINAARSNLTSTSVVFSPDLNSIVTHKPDLGFQLGFSTGYPLSKKIRLISGLQFNVSKYDIRAYNYPGEVATIALSTASGATSTVSTITNYRSAGGSKANWLRNLYVSASAPIGVELKLASNKKTYWGVSGTVQPTYVLGNTAYVISTDYKNYAEIPSLTRKWNINTGFEAFAGFSVGKTDWRVGPQVRYQTMSSFKKEYPVREYLFDFGLKMGIMLKK